MGKFRTVLKKVAPQWIKDIRRRVIDGGKSAEKTKREGERSLKDNAFNKGKGATNSVRTENKNESANVKNATQDEPRRLYERDLQLYNSMVDRTGGGGRLFLYKKENEYPILMDRFKGAGSLDIHYFCQDIYMAHEIFSAQPKEHYDIGSRVDGFISHLLSFRDSVTLIDIRPLPVEIKGLKFIQGDAMGLKGIEDNSIESLSSLHALEHFGLGRYGDPVNPEGYVIALKAMQRVLRHGGTLYLSVPIGPENKLMFNAHRIFEIHTIPNVLDECRLVKFSYIMDYKVIAVGMEEMPFYKIPRDYLCGLYVFKRQ